VGVGLPVTTTGKDCAVPTVKVTVLLLVITGAWGAALTIRVKLWVAGGPDPLAAMKVMFQVPAVVGVPDSSPPPEVGEKETPVGSAPDSVTTGDGLPVAVTLKDPGPPAAKV
jgi:hypothetical protein